MRSTHCADRVLGRLFDQLETSNNRIFYGKSDVRPDTVIELADRLSRFIPICWSHPQSLWLDRHGLSSEPALRFMLWDGRLPLPGHDKWSSKEAKMTINLLAIDLGKQSFHLHGVYSGGVVLSRKVSRANLFAVVNELSPLSIAMEACPSAHYWGRRFQEAGGHVRLIHPRFVKPFVHGAKHDAFDAEAIFEAGRRPRMRFVPVKTLAQ
jgi:hypothetical protein